MIISDFDGLGMAVVIDLETTGFVAKSDRIVSFAAIKCDFTSLVLPPSGQINLRTETLSEVLNPTIPIPTEASRIHGFTDSSVVGKRTFSEAAQELREFIAEYPIVSHNMKFDGAFLDAELARSKAKALRTNERYCTMLATHKRAEFITGNRMRWPRLADCGQYVGMNFSQAEMHSAIEDAKLALMLVVGLKTTYFDEKSRRILRY